MYSPMAHIRLLKRVVRGPDGFHSHKNGLSPSIVMTSNQLMARGAKGKRFRLTLVFHKPRFEPGWVCGFGRPIFSSERAHWTPACLCLIALYEDHAEMPLLLLSTPFLWHVAMKIALYER